MAWGGEVDTSFIFNGRLPDFTTLISMDDNDIDIKAGLEAERDSIDHVSRWGQHRNGLAIDELIHGSVTHIC